MSNDITKAGLEIIVQTKDLVQALNFAGSIVEKRNVLSELSNIKFTATASSLSIGATDIDLYLNQSIGAQVIKEGVTTVSSQTLSDIARRIKDDEIKLMQSPSSDKLEVIGKNCRFELLTLPAAKFPPMEDLSAETVIGVNSGAFVKMLQSTCFAMSSEETRYNLNGIYLHVANGNFCSAATDGHRLSISQIFGGAKNVKDFGVIVPRKTVNEFHKILKDYKNESHDLKISLGSNKIKFEIDNIILISKLIDGTFPDYNAFIPTKSESKLIIKTKLLAEAIDRIAAITVDKFRAIKIVSGSNSLKINASGEAKGVGEESIAFSEKPADYCQFSGPEQVIGFNPRYLSDVLSAVESENVQIFLIDQQSPVLIEGEGQEHDRFVVMPVKV